MLGALSAVLSSHCSPFRLFEDVEPALKAWAAKSLSVYLFSAGTVDTQKLLFGYSAKGDLQEVCVLHAIHVD